jgi:hypothetical protein
MATCRICRGIYPQEHFITGNGPRHLVCERCGVEKGYVTADETSHLYDEATSRARMVVVGRRFSPFLWLILGWLLWAIYFAGLPLWGNASLVILLLTTLVVPVMYFLGGAKYQADMRRLSTK